MFRFAAVVATAALSVGAVRADEKAEIRKEVEKQIELIKKGDANKLKDHFTERQRERITGDAVKAAKKTAADANIDDLVDSVTTDKDKEGRKTVKVKMKNGRTLTTFVEVDGKWLADTIWFK
jgi:ATP-dependent protease HslVU (ClpYQ) ATPase subunit